MTTTILRHPGGSPASMGGKFKGQDRPNVDIPLTGVYDPRQQPEAAAYRHMVLALFEADPGLVAARYEMDRVDLDRVNETINRDLDAHAQTDSLFGVDDAPPLTFTDEFGVWKDQASPYVLIPTAFAEANSQSCDEDNAVDDGWIASRTWATGDPAKPYVTVEVVAYPMAFEVAGDEVTALSTNEHQNIMDADLYSQRQFQLADQIEEQLAADPSIPAAKMQVAQADAARLREQAKDAQDVAGRVRYAVCTRTTTYIHDDPALPWSGQSNQPEYEDTSGVWIETLSTARRACENAVRHLNWQRDVSPRLDS